VRGWSVGAGETSASAPEAGENSFSVSGFMRAEVGKDTRRG
jgi:hypothetical protein